MSDREVHVVIVAYHAPEALDRALAALGQDFWVTVVDNSQSGAVRAVSRHRTATYIETTTNRGFAAGVNAALRTILSGSPQDVLLLNPDAVISPSDVRVLSDVLGGRARTGSLAPRLVGAAGESQRVAWPFPSPGGAWREALGWRRRRRAGEEFVIGAVLLLRWEALQEVGLFDERFFLYAEEVDWQRRAAGLGWETGVCGEVVALHEGGGTSDNEFRRQILFHAAHEIYIRKWYGARGWWSFRAAVLVGAVARATLLHGERRGQALRRAWIYLRGPRRLAGLLALAR